MQAPESKALNHILSFTDKNCSSSQASTCMLCELSALDQTDLIFLYQSWIQPKLLIAWYISPRTTIGI